MSASILAVTYMSIENTRKCSLEWNITFKMYPN